MYNSLIYLMNWGYSIQLWPEKIRYRSGIRYKSSPLWNLVGGLELEFYFPQYMVGGLVGGFQKYVQ